jgi:hypothetical protein
VLFGSDMLGLDEIPLIIAFFEWRLPVGWMKDLGLGDGLRFLVGRKKALGI